MGRGKSKGGQFERDACVGLSKWWSRKGDEDLFWRTHGSGNRATVRSTKGRKTSGQYGDVCAVDGRGATLIKAFTISLKRGYQTISLQDIADQFETKKTPSQFEVWIKEAIRDHRAAGSIGWLLILRKNRRRALVFIPMSMLFKLEFSTVKELLDVHPCVLFRLSKRMGRRRLDMKSPKNYLNWWLKHNTGVFGVRLEDFLRIVGREEITKMVRKHYVS